MDEVDVTDTDMPVELKMRVHSYIESARKIMEECGQLKPMCFIGVDDGNNLAMFPWANVPNTEIATAAMRVMCKEGNAAWIINIMEAYLKRGRTDGEVGASLKKYGSVKNMPDRQEAVTCFVETRERAWTGLAMTTHLESNRATFGPMMFSSVDTIEGRFVGLLANRGTEH